MTPCHFTPFTRCGSLQSETVFAFVMKCSGRNATGSGICSQTKRRPQQISDILRFISAAADNFPARVDSMLLYVHT